MPDVNYSAVFEIIVPIAMAIGAFFVGGLQGWRGKQDDLTAFLRERVYRLENEIREMHKRLAAQEQRLGKMEAQTEIYLNENKRLKIENQQLKLTIEELKHDN